MKILFQPEVKGWFNALGLHHAALTLTAIFLGNLVGLGAFMAAFWMGWYGSREWGWDWRPPKTFEIMDFVSPSIVSIIYLTTIQG